MVDRIPIALIDLASEYRELSREIDPLIRSVLESGSFILGSQGQAFEQELGAFLGGCGVVGVNSGTDALVLMLRAIDLKPGDEVIVPAYSFFATAEAVVLAGGRPVFVDVLPDSLAIDPEAAERSCGPRTRAILAVHLYGEMADVQRLAAICQRRKISFLEDNAQAIGAERDGVRAGTAGQMAAFSFFPTKNLGAYGDAGAVSTPSEALANRVRMLRSHGSRVRYEHLEIGYNSRLDELQAAILRVKLHHLPAWNERRRALAQRYRQGLQGLPLLLPSEAPKSKSVYHLFTVRTDRREALRACLEKAGIASAVHYPRPMHLQEAMKPWVDGSLRCPVAEKASREVLSLPLYPQLKDTQIDRIVQEIRNFYGAR